MPVMNELGIKSTVVAKWQSRGGKYWLNLIEETSPGLAPGWSYKGDNCGGYLGSTGTRADMIAYLARTQLAHWPSRPIRVL